MPLNFNIPREGVKELVDFLKANGVVGANAQTSDVDSKAGRVVYTFEGTDAVFHDGNSSTPKSETQNTVSSVNVDLFTAYHELSIEHKAADELEEVIADLIEASKKTFINTIDKLPAGTVEDQPTGKFTTQKEVDETAESWVEAIQSVEDNGFTPTSIVIDASKKSLLSKAVNDGVTGTNPLHTGALTEINGIPVTLVKGLSNGTDTIGYIADLEATVFLYAGEIEVYQYSAENSLTAGRANRNILLLKWNIGFNVLTQGAGVVLTVDPAEEGGTEG